MRDYRPISVLNSVSKVVEKVQSNQVRDFRENKKPFDGFSIWI